MNLLYPAKVLHYVTAHQFMYKLRYERPAPSVDGSGGYVTGNFAVANTSATESSVAVGTSASTTSAVLSSSSSASVSGNKIGVTGAGGEKDARAEEHRKQVLKQQQQRLLLLRHASKCAKEVCDVTPHCANMKLLWKHIMSCKEKNCKMPHCVSSRYVLSHYSKCRDTACPVCGPVRDAIQEHYERSNQMLNAGTRISAGAQGAVRNNTDDSGEKGKKTTGKVAAVKAVKSNRTASEVGPDGKAEKKPAKKRSSKKAEEPAPAQTQRPGANGGGLPTEPKPPAQPKTNNLDPISCAVYGFSNSQIEAHLKNISEGVVTTKSMQDVKSLCLTIVDNLLKHPSGRIFAQPVDPVMYNLTDYFDIVKNPMDLGTIRKRLEKVGGSDPYRDIRQVAADVALVFNNAILYNPKEHDIHKVAVQMKKTAENQFRQTIAAYERKIEETKKHKDFCSICGEGNLKFEPPVYYCQGSCGGQRIRRNAHYYSTTNNLNHWCQNCFSEMKDNQAIVIPEKTIYKRDIAGSKKKHQEESEEPWVGCDVCKRWVHQVCGLFNSRRNVSDEVAFVCPTCILEKRRKDKLDQLMANKKMRAFDLPHSNMSMFIERRVQQRLEKAYKERAESEGIPLEDIEKSNELCIRQVASVDRMQQVREGVRERYKQKGYPTEFPCRTKCVILFQNIDGQDVVLFGMYVYEYGHKCPQPNQRRVYVSYLDSVHYFRPRHYRTMVYQEIIVSYLEYVKNRGFHTAHIWACPPLKGDDYILYCHPQAQKTPKDDMLRRWYDNVLKICMERGIASSITDLYTEFLESHLNDATILPYFEGDYWVNEAEVIIKDLKKLENRRSKSSEALLAMEGAEGEGDGRKKTKAKRKGAPKRTRSGKAESEPQGPRNADAVMAKLGDIIKPMKEAFFVAHLHPKEYADRWAAELAEEMEQEKIEKDGEEENKTKKIKLEEGVTTEANTKSSSSSSTTASAGSDIAVATDDDGGAKMDVDQAKTDASGGTVTENGGEGARAGAEQKVELAEATKSVPTTTGVHVQSSSETAESKVDETTVAAEDLITQPPAVPAEEVVVKSEGDRMDVDEGEKDQVATADAVTESKMEEGQNEVQGSTFAETVDQDSGKSNAPLDLSKTAATAADSSSQSSSVSEVQATTDDGSSAAGALEREKAQESYKLETEEEKEEKLMSFKNDKTDDVDDVQESDYFSTRQDVLQLCQGNHYQFDQLRRAKHTSMMVLYHLHNPDAPKFVPTCSLCMKEILAGYRHRCESCDIDICHSCVTSAPPGSLHPHPLRPMALSGAPQQLTEEQRKERQKSIEMHLHLLKHSSSCVNKECKSKNCMKMKQFLQHGMTCKTSVKGGCPVCKRIYNLLTLHARTCRSERCPVLKCNELRETFRQLELRQQQMDDRRRAMMNQVYQRVSAPAAEPD